MILAELSLSGTYCLRSGELVVINKRIAIRWLSLNPVTDISGNLREVAIVELVKSTGIDDVDA